MTPYEHMAENVLKGENIEYIPQHIIKDKNYIVDFYLPKFNVIIELDGKQHKESRFKQKDLLRDSYLWRKGYKVIRLNNKDIGNLLDELRKHGYS